MFQRYGHLRFREKVMYKYRKVSKHYDSQVGLMFFENRNQFLGCRCLSESNKILYIFKASSDKLDDLDNFVTVATFSVHGLNQGKNNSLNYCALVGAKSISMHEFHVTSSP